MLGMPVSKSNSGDAGRGDYEYGEYDGVMDVEAILHTTSGASPNSTGSPTVAGSDIGVYGNYMSIQGDNRNGGIPTPLGRGAPRKPTRMNVSPAVNGDNQSAAPSSAATTPGFHGAVVGSSSDGAAAPTAARRANGSHTSAEADTHDASALSARQGTRKSLHTDDVVHLPAIGNQQQVRKKASEVFPTRARAAASAPDSSNAATSPTSSNGNARAAGTGGKSVTSAGNFESLQAPTDSCGAASSNQYTASVAACKHKPPYHAPPLSPLTAKGRHGSTDVNRTSAAGSAAIGSSVGASLQDVGTRHRSATDGTVKRGESVGTDEGGYMNGHCGRAATHHTAGSSSKVVTVSKTNGWVKEEARRLDHRASASSNTATSPRGDPQAFEDAINSLKSRNITHQAASQFPRERMKDKPSKGSISAKSPSADGRDSALGHNSNEDVNTHAKVNTSPVPVTPKAYVWAGDYEMASTPGVGSTNFSVVPMPKVSPRPFAGGLKPSTAVDSNNRSGTKSPPQAAAQIVHPLSAEAVAAASGNGVTSSTESAITPLRKVFTRPQKPASNNSGAAAQAAQSTCPIPHVPLTNPPVATATSSRFNNAAQSAAASASPTPSKTALMSGHAVAAAKGDKPPSAPHTPTLSHRRIMNAVDTNQHSHAHYPGAAEQTSPTYGSSRVATQDQASDAGMGLPYSDERRAALEAWADVLVLSITIRGQNLAPTHRAREMAKMRARPADARQMYAPVNGQGRQEVAGEPCDLNYDVHNVVVQLRHRNRPLVMNYPPRLPLEADMRPRMRRQRTPRSFYGNRMPHVGDAWFKDALNDARMVESPDVESMEKREEAEFIRNGGDPATRRNRYGQANNAYGHQQQQQTPLQQGGGGGAEVEAGIDAVNRNGMRMEQPAS
ncbi:conserved hypothetical protein [Leishmania infantum JPCM5]|uniref:Uncharacterized protein n=2 Tax=Leishmania infantum TaxID=5671 RepID=A4HYU5_LEIIN|nr:conserved hypothetical protein [Leishmania infantum JPCM5]CAC9484532.1 hypothetical_protein_-_conserved [Leishmania infantum]CAM67484.1 conserved hypothetical protein [Leishmania infantum JPCM5]SUZ41380.1 hypothetical_protein_-_conserved [Leishmania infantum]|eukprot:XP_001465236.1 conserved hypothetical protein [Leishmania infantum JPCM5]